MKNLLFSLALLAITAVAFTSFTPSTSYADTPVASLEPASSIFVNDGGTGDVSVSVPSIGRYNGSVRQAHYQGNLTFGCQTLNDGVVMNYVMFYPVGLFMVSHDSNVVDVEYRIGSTDYEGDGWRVLNIKERDTVAVQGAQAVSFMVDVWREKPRTVSIKAKGVTGGVWTVFDVAGIEYELETAAQACSWQ